MSEVGKIGELRCFCSRRPLLAVYGINSAGELYVHIRVYKQNRVYGEAIFTGGKVELHCRECFRWHGVRIIQPAKATLEEKKSPSVAVEAQTRQ